MKKAFILIPVLFFLIPIVLATEPTVILNETFALGLPYGAIVNNSEDSPETINLTDRGISIEFNRESNAYIGINLSENLTQYDNFSLKFSYNNTVVGGGFHVIGLSGYPQEAGRVSGDLLASAESPPAAMDLISVFFDDNRPGSIILWNGTLINRSKSVGYYSDMRNTITYAELWKKDRTINYTIYSDQYQTQIKSHEFNYDNENTAGFPNKLSHFFISADYLSGSTTAQYSVIGNVSVTAWIYIGIVPSYLNIVSFNTSDVLKDEFLENEEYCIALNLTDQYGAEIEEANCNITLTPTPFFNKSCIDTSVYGVPEQNISNNSPAIRVNFNNTMNNLHDYFSFDICHTDNTTTLGDLLIRVNCSNQSDYKFIYGFEITLCEDRYTHIYENFDVCINSSMVTIDIYNNNTYPMKVGYPICYEKMDFYEFYSVVSDESEICNITPISRNYSVSAECSKSGYTNSNDTTVIPVINNEVATEFYFFVNDNDYYNFSTIEFDEEEEINLSNVPLTLFEYIGGEYTWHFSAYDHDLYAINLMFANISLANESYEGDPFYIYPLLENNTLLNPFPVNTTNSFFADFSKQPYYLVIWGEDTQGRITLRLGSFMFNDTVFPTASGIENHSAIINTTDEFSVYFEDENFFSYNVTCNNSFSQGEEGLNVTSYTANFSIGIEADTLCSWEYCDGHTDNKLKNNWQVTKSDLRKEFKFKVGKNENKLKYMGSEEIELNFEKKEDKIEFNMNFPKASKDNLKDYIFYYETSSPSYYFKSSEYPAWIVDPVSKTWFDMAGINGDINVYQVSDNTWEITVTSTATELKAESIGELNCNYQEQLITATEETGRRELLRPLSCPTNTVDVLLWIAIIGIFITFLIINHMYMRYPIIDLLLGLGFILFGASAIGCAEFFGVILIAIGIIIMGYATLGWKE